MNDPMARLGRFSLRGLAAHAAPPAPAGPVPATLTRADLFPTAVPRPVPLTRAEEALVQGFLLYMQVITEMAQAFGLVPLDRSTAAAVVRALEVAGADRDRLGDQMVHEHRLRRAAERDRDAAERARDEAVRALSARQLTGGRTGG